MDKHCEKSENVYDGTDTNHRLGRGGGNSVLKSPRIREQERCSHRFWSVSPVFLMLLTYVLAWPIGMLFCTLHIDFADFTINDL